MSHTNGNYWDMEAPTSEFRWRWNGGNIAMHIHGSGDFKAFRDIEAARNIKAHGSLNATGDITTPSNIGAQRYYAGAGAQFHGIEHTQDYTDNDSDWWTNGGSIQGDPPNLHFTLYCQHAVRAHTYVAFSDRRIKKNITEIDDSNALETLRKLNPTTYNYIDKTRNTRGKVIGFIAQEVAEVLPNAVFKTNGLIPTIQCEASVEILNDIDIKLVLTEPLPDNHTVSPESKLILKTPNKEYIKFEVVSLESNTTIIVKDKDGYEEIKNKTRVWVFGEEINDFHNLDKNAIFTVATAALQEVDRQLQDDKVKTFELQQKVEILEMSQGVLIQRIEALEKL